MADNYPSDWSTRRKDVYKRDDYTCQNCGRGGMKKDNIQLHAHHVVPVSDGGTHARSNLKTLCKDCHNAIHGDGLAPTADAERADSLDGDNLLETKINPFMNIDPFDKCPICKAPYDFETASNSRVYPDTTVAACASCRTEFSARESSFLSFKPELTISDSSYDIEQYSMNAAALKRLEDEEIGHLNELKKYEQESRDNNSRIRNIFFGFVGISILIFIIGIATGEILMMFLAVFATLIISLIAIKIADSQVKYE